MIVKVQGCKSDFILSFTVRPWDVESPDGSRVPAVPLAVSRSAHLPRTGGLPMNGTGAMKALPAAVSAHRSELFRDARLCKLSSAAVAVGRARLQGHEQAVIRLSITHFVEHPLATFDTTCGAQACLTLVPVLRSHAVFWRTPFSGAAQPAASR